MTLKRKPHPGYPISEAATQLEGLRDSIAFANGISAARHPTCSWREAASYEGPITLYLPADNTDANTVVCKTVAEAVAIIESGKLHGQPKFKELVK